MAILDGDVSFTGPLGNLSAYRMRGVDRIILRRKGGPSKKKIKTSERFDLVRRNNSEFGGRAVDDKWVMRGMKRIKHLGDYNISGPLNALMKPLQLLSTNVRGQRDVLLSRNPKILEGFSLNKNVPFDAVVRIPVHCFIDRTNRSARIEIPALVAGINLFTPKNNPMYALTISLGAIPDIKYKGEDLGYRPVDGYEYAPIETSYTDWYPIVKGSPASTIELKLKHATTDDGFSLIVAIGIRYGQMTDATTIDEVQQAGSAKVLGMG